MVVIAIVAVLSAVAVPAYKEYTIRAKVASYIPMADTLKKKISDYYNKGVSTYHASGVAPQTDLQPFPEGVSGDGRPVGLRQLSTLSHGVIQIEAQTSALGISQAGRLIVTLTPNDDTSGVLTWTCGHFASLRDQIPLSYLPSACQVDSTSTADNSM